MKILTRYILKEMITPTLLGLAFYTSIIVMRQLFELAGLMIRGSLTGGQVGQLMLFMLPNVVVLTLPMSLLFGILIAIGRLSADSEIIAIRALGSSMRTIYRPVFLFSLFLFFVNMYLMNVLLPRGNKAFESLKAELITSGIEKEVRPRVFHDEFPNVVLYVDDMDPVTGLWKGVFVADTRGSEDQGTTPQDAVDQNAAHTDDAPAAFGSNGQRIVAASTGNLSLLKQPDGSKQIWLNLQQAETHVWDPSRSDRYDLSRNTTQRLLLAGRAAEHSVSENIRIKRDIRSLSLTELIDKAEETRDKDPYSYKLARVEIQKKFAIPFACLAFGIMGLPLGITNRRGGKSSGFSLSIGIIVLYYVAYTNGEFLAASGRVHPFIGVWGANVIMVAAGIWLIGRANREIGAQREGGFFQRFFGRFRTEDRHAAVHDDEGSSVLARLDVTFPNIIDRYVLREFGRTLVLVLISVLALFVVASYTEMSKDIRENNIPLHTVFAYYRFYFAQLLNDTLPISVLVATLVTFGMLSKNNEITAVKASGVSLFRLSVPIVAVAIVLSFFAYLILDFVLPFSNQRADAIKRRIDGKPPISASGQQRLWFRGKGHYIINFLAYDRNAKVLSQISVFEFHPTDFRLTRRVSAQRATWNGSAWVFENGWIRSFTDDRHSTYSPITQPLPLHYAETPEQFETEVRPPEQMTFAQLRRYVSMIRNAGYSAEALDVRLWAKTSWPVISVIMALIALPFAFRMGKRGALYGVGIGLILGIIYWLLFAVFMKFGEFGNLPPLLAAWSANILFGIAAVYMFLHVET